MLRFTNLGALVILVGCSSQVAVKPVTISQVVRNIADDLHGSGAVTVEGSAVWTPAEYAAFDAKIRNAQCYAQTADPIIPLIQKDVELQLQGQLSANGSFTMSASLMPGVSSGLTAGRQQTITVPVTFTAISDIPGLVAAHEKQLAEGHPDESGGKGRMGAAMPVDQFQTHIDGLITSFNPATCAGSTAATPGMLMMAKPPPRFGHSPK